MPLARILTRYPEQAGALSHELRQHGYTVEFAAPEMSGKTPADLEIDFELCAQDDALSRASELAEEFHADVAVSQGVVELPRGDEPALETQKLAEQALQEHEAAAAAASFAAEETAPLDRVIEDPAVEEPVRHFAQAKAEPMQAEVALPPNLLETDRELVEAEATPMNASAPLEQAPAAESWHEHEEHVAPEEAVARANAAWQDELNIARAAGDAREIHPEQDRLAEVHDKSAAVLKSAALAGGALWARTQDLAGGFWASLKQITAEYREGLLVRRAEMKAEREHKLLEMEKRRVMAEERAAELEAARQAAAMKLQQLLRERGGLTEAQPAPPERQVIAAPPVAGPERKRLWAGRIRIPLTRAYRPQLEAVLMGVAAACLLFVLGVAVASFHARPAISSSVNAPSNGVTLPSKGVTLQGGGVTLKPAAQPVSPAAKPAPVARTQVAKPAPGNKVTQPARRDSDVTVRNVDAAKPSPRRDSAGGAGDVVVRHFGAPAAKPTQSPAQAGLKHISDLDN